MFSALSEGAGASCSLPGPSDRPSPRAGPEHSRGRAGWPGGSQFRADSPGGGGGRSQRSELESAALASWNPFSWVKRQFSGWKAAEGGGVGQSRRRAAPVT